MNFDTYNRIKEYCEKHSVTLIAVSKTHSATDIKSLYDIGQRHFGENKVQELIEKQALLPTDINWHMIGHLQTNKVKAIAPFVHLIHSVDSLNLLKEIEKQASNLNRRIEYLIQIRIAQEDTKFGLDPDALEKFLESETFKQSIHSHLRGLMGIATNTADIALIQNEFAFLKNLFDSVQLRNSFDAFDTLSMGMSSDYPLAVKHGSNMIRVGSLIFGERDYSKKTL